MSSHKHKRLLHIRQRTILTDELYTIPRDLTPICTFTPETSVKIIAVESDKRLSSQVEKDSPRQTNEKHAKDHNKNTAAHTQSNGKESHTTALPEKQPKNISKLHKAGLIEPIVPDKELRDYEIIVNDRVHKIPTTKEYLLKEFADVFQGVGRLPGPPYHIRLVENYTQVQHPPWSVPVSMQSVYKAELDRLMWEDIITEVNQHTEWVNSIVPVTKPDRSIRLCLDPKDLNKAIKWNQWCSRTLDDILPHLSKACAITLNDATSGYWYVTLALQSSLLTTFNTSWGTFWWLRLPFG